MDVYDGTFGGQLEHFKAVQPECHYKSSRCNCSKIKHHLWKGYKLPDGKLGQIRVNFMQLLRSNTFVNYC